MAWYKDLSPLDYFGPELADVYTAVGWLDGTRPYHRGDVSETVFRRLETLLTDPWEPFTYAGIHKCTLSDSIPALADIKTFISPATARSMSPRK